MFRFMFKPPAGVWDGPIPPVAQLHADLPAEAALQNVGCLYESSVKDYKWNKLWLVQNFK